MASKLPELLLQRQAALQVLTRRGKEATRCSCQSDTPLEKGFFVDFRIKTIKSIELRTRLSDSLTSIFSPAILLKGPLVASILEITAADSVSFNIST